jgi:CheY-like chemotaxis protein
LPANIGIRAALPERVPMVVANASQVHQVLMNLCSNAAHAMAERGGSIEIGGDVVTVDGTQFGAPAQLTRGSYVRVDVSDNGHGMSAETLEHIFEPFFTTKRAGAGTGLGLAVVQGIMRDHHGAVVADSRPEQGTTMRLFFPVWTRAAERPQTTPLATGNGERLLVVGDGSSTLALALETLITLGYQVRECGSGRAALELLRAEPRAFDLLIVDASSAAASELARQLGELRWELPTIIMCSVHEARELSNQAKTGEVLVKPFSLEMLSQALRRALRR